MQLLLRRTADLSALKVKHRLRPVHQEVAERENKQRVLCSLPGLHHINYGAYINLHRLSVSHALLACRNYSLSPQTVHGRFASQNLLQFQKNCDTPKHC